MTMNIRTVTLAACSFLVWGCSSSSQTVGEGAALSTLSETPTGAELYLAMVNAMGSSSLLFNRAAPNATRTVASQTYNDEDTANCPVGGSITTKFNLTAESETTGSGKIDVSYDDCGITMVLDGNSYSEVITGSANADLKIQNNFVNSSGHMGLTIAGDLGLAFECNLSASGDVDDEVDSVSVSGDCEFTDSAGTTLPIDGDEIQALFN